MLRRMKMKAEVGQKAAQEVAVDQGVVLAQMMKTAAQTVEVKIQVEVAVNLVQRKRKRRKNSMQLIQMRKQSLNQLLSST